MNKKLKALICAATIAATAFVLMPLQAKASAKVYELNQTVRAYYTSENAEKNTSAVSEYKSGEYFIYKESNGMINITKVEGQPGAWINPKDNKAVEKFNLLTEVNAYYTSKDAMNREDAVKKYGAGEYFVYKVAEGMVNITKNIATPGAWINPKDNTVNKPSDGDIVLSSNVDVYMTAADAMDEKNAAKVYGAGEYFIYKSVPGAINITKVKGTPGAWIKTGEAEVTPAPEVTTKPDTKPEVTTKPEATKPEVTTKAETTTTRPETSTTTKAETTTTTEKETTTTKPETTTTTEKETTTTIKFPKLPEMIYTSSGKIFPTLNDALEWGNDNLIGSGFDGFRVVPLNESDLNTEWTVQWYILK